MKVTIVHGDIETPEEQESITALANQLHNEVSWVNTHGTNDTTTWTVSRLSENFMAMLDACRVLYPWWKIKREEG